MQHVKRQTAYRTWISSLSTSTYVKQEGWDPNYVELDGKQVSRVNLLATVVSKFVSDDGNYAAITIDDGTDTIRCKAFGPDVVKLKDLKVGSVVRVIGKVKEYNEEIHLSPEVACELDDPNWIIVWSLELGKPKAVIKSIQKPSTVAPVAKPDVGSNNPSDQNTEEVQSPPEENYSGNVLEIIKKLDTGDGANTEDVIKESKLDPEEAKNIVVGLLRSGDIFEPKKGILKPL